MKPVQSVSFSTLVAVLALTRQTYCFPNFDDWNVLLSQNIENCKSEAITPDGRSVDQLQQLNWALEDAITIAHHGIIAATKPEEPPFNYFFRPTDNETVVQHLQMVIDLREYPTSFRPGTHVSMECNDPDWCTLPNQWGITNLWYGEQLNWGIVICEYGLNALQRNPPACTGNPGLPSLGWIMLKYLLQMWNIRKPIGVVGDYAFGPNDCHELIEIAGATPTTNAENFAYMASWAHDLGLKGDGEEPCPWKWIRPTLLPPFAADGTNNPNAHPGSLD